MALSLEQILAQAFAPPKPHIAQIDPRARGGFRRHALRGVELAAAGSSDRRRLAARLTEYQFALLALEYGEIRPEHARLVVRYLNKSLPKVSPRFLADHVLAGHLMALPRDNTLAAWGELLPVSYQVLASQRRAARGLLATWHAEAMDVAAQEFLR